MPAVARILRWLVFALASAAFFLSFFHRVAPGAIAEQLTAGGITAGVGSIIFGEADSVVMAAVGRTLTGLGVSVAFVSLLKLNALS